MSNEVQLQRGRFISRQLGCVQSGKSRTAVFRLMPRAGAALSVFHSEYLPAENHRERRKHTQRYVDTIGAFLRLQHKQVQTLSRTQTSHTDISSSLGDVFLTNTRPQLLLLTYGRYVNHLVTLCGNSLRRRGGFAVENLNHIHRGHLILRTVELDRLYKHRGAFNSLSPSPTFRR